MAKPEPRPPSIFYLRKEILKTVEEAVKVAVVFKETVHALFRPPAPECGPDKTRTVILTLRYSDNVEGKFIYVTGDLGRIQEKFTIVNRIGVE